MAKYLNPPFDPRIYSQMFLQQDGRRRALQRGYIIAKAQTGATDAVQKSGAAIRFLYNPSTVSMSWQADTQNLAPGDTSDNGNPLGPSTGIGDANFDLLFDRTYELWDRRRAGGRSATHGVGVDFDAFRKFTGNMYDPSVGVGNKEYDYSSIQPVFASFMFGRGPGVLEIYGFISGLSVQVTHWTQNMIPARCVVGLQIVQTPMGVLDTTGGGTPSPSNPGNGQRDPRDTNGDGVVDWRDLLPSGRGGR